MCFTNQVIPKVSVSNLTRRFAVDGPQGAKGPPPRDGGQGWLLVPAGHIAGPRGIPFLGRELGLTQPEDCHSRTCKTPGQGVWPDFSRPRRTWRTVACPGRRKAPARRLHHWRKRTVASGVRTSPYARAVDCPGQRSAVLCCPSCAACLAWRARLRPMLRPTEALVRQNRQCDHTHNDRGRSLLPLTSSQLLARCGGVRRRSGRTRCRRHRHQSRRLQGTGSRWRVAGVLFRCGARKGSTGARRDNSHRSEE